MKKTRAKGFYDSTFNRCVKRTGRWRGKLSHLYKKYKRAKKVLPQPYFNESEHKIIIPKDYREKSEVLIWEKIIYQQKLS